MQGVELRVPEKKFSLKQHVDDAEDWWLKSHGDSYYYGIDKDSKQQMFFIAYERWLNNRELLSMEDKKTPT